MDTPSPPLALASLVLAAPGCVRVGIAAPNPRIREAATLELSALIAERPVEVSPEGQMALPLWVVGTPKNLSDLRRIEAQVRVTCKICKATEVWELDALIAEVRANEGNTDWHTAPYALKCPKRCRSPMITLLPIPFGKERARKAAHRHALINLASTILREAAARSAREAVGTIEVRLALHVLRPFVRGQALLNEFWRAATPQPRQPWLVDRGAPVEDANRP